MEQDTFAGLPITVNRKYMDLSLLTPDKTHLNLMQILFKMVLVLKRNNHYSTL